MTGTRPRDLTADERALLDNPVVGAAESVPLRIPPGTEVAIELLDPRSKETTSASPSTGPGETPA